jgi:hypothetical protein
MLAVSVAGVSAGVVAIVLHDARTMAANAARAFERIPIPWVPYGPATKQIEPGEKSPLRRAERAFAFDKLRLTLG